VAPTNSAAIRKGGDYRNEHPECNLSSVQVVTFEQIPEIAEVDYSRENRSQSRLFMSSNAIVLGSGTAPLVSPEATAVQWSGKNDLDRWAEVSFPQLVVH
jgi:hypothetical protein